MQKMITPKIIKEYLEINSGIEDIGIKSRKTEFVFMRYVYYQLTYDFCKSYNLRQVGECVNQDHALTLHGRKKFKDLSSQRIFSETFNTYKKAYSYFSVIEGNDKIKDRLSELENEKQKLINQIEVNEVEVLR